MEVPGRRFPLRRTKDRAHSYRVEHRYGRDASGRSVAFPDWPTAPERISDIAVVLHVSSAAELEPYAAMLDAQPTRFDLYVVSDVQVETDSEQAADGIREYLIADPVADGLYQLASLANSGRLSGYRTVIRHVHRDAASSDDFARLVGADPLASLDLFVHQRLPRAGVVSRALTPVAPEMSVTRATQLALRVSMRITEIDAEPRSIRTFALRGSLVESLCTLRLDHQDFYVKYSNYIDEGLASERPGPVAADPHIGRAIELLYLRLIDAADMTIETLPDLAGDWRPTAEGVSYSPRAQVWALYHPDLTTRTAVRNASWSHIVGSRPMHFGQELPVSPVDLNFSDPLSPTDRAAQTKLAIEHGITGFLVALRWDENGLSPSEFLESLDVDEHFPWAALLSHPVQARTNPVADRARYSAWTDPGVAHYAAIAKQVVDGFARGAYLRVDGRPVVLIQDLEMVTDPEAFVTELRAASDRGGENAWIVVVESHLATARPGEGLYPSFVDGMIQLPPASAHHRRWARLSTRVNGYSGPAFELNSRDAFAVALAGRDDDRVIPGAAVGYDTTPVLRSQGEVGYNWNVFTFRNALDAAVRSVAWRNESSRIVAINSWNGWSDLSQLEPSSQRMRSYLSTVRDVLEFPRAQ